MFFAHEIEDDRDDNIVDGRFSSLQKLCHLSDPIKTEVTHGKLKLRNFYEIEEESEMRD